ncbi:G-protein coupled receptor Mth2-like isoform X6 [Cimex lectularius]|uniref:G-protein coupled receptors family 2 profile 2 domain-containing protein n=1 Tax=Cimex lectularius TaxID=79782 RepID=A0A8I6RXH6_CIMLE|nr:G-protein coupled receptor Mth2-like isoform X6 [Cimex lectularius]
MLLAIQIVSFFLLAYAALDRVRKCCPPGQAFDEDFICSPSDNKLLNPFRPWKDLPSFYSPLFCPNESKVSLDPGEYSLLDDGTLYVDQEQGYKYTEFCFELDSNESEIKPFICIDDDDKDDTSTKIYPIGMIISLPFLLITLITYIILPSLHNKHGYCLMGHITAMIFGYTTLTVTQIYADVFLVSCITLGFAVQFFFLATFFWLNVMCIDIYWAFSGIKLRGTASERDRKKLLAYSFYAWGMPLIILAVTVGVDYSDSIPSSSIFKPNMGKDRCFFKGRTATWTYFYGPMAVILFSNLILFSITAYRIWRHRRETAQSFHRGDSRRHDGNESERFNLYLKLFLVMGINWISELISFMFGKDVPQYLWYITDITNTLQGVFIFLIFVWKKRVRKLLWEKLCGGKQSQLRSSTMTTSTALNSSTR